MTNETEAKIEQEYNYLQLQKAHGDLVDAYKKLEIEAKANATLLAEARKETEKVTQDLRTMTSKYEDGKADLAKCREDVGRKNGQIDDLERENKRVKESLDISNGIRVKEQEDYNTLFGKYEKLLDESKRQLEELISVKAENRALKDAREKDRSKASTIGKPPRKITIRTK